MKVTLHSTDKIIQVTSPGSVVALPARLWEGKTEAGVPVVAVIVRMSPDVENPSPETLQEFARDLQECDPPRDGGLAMVFPAVAVL